MKVLHTAESIKGGVGTVIRSLLRDQAAFYGADRVLCLVPENQKNELEPLWPGRVFTFKRSGRNFLSFLRFTISFIGVCWRERPDLVHIHSAFAGFMARLSLMALSPFYRPSIVYCPHAWAFLRDESPFKRRIYASVEIFFSVFTHKIICVSRYEREEGLRCGLPGEKMDIIQNGTVIPALVSEPQPRSDEDEISLLFIGSFDYQKGFDILLEAMKQLEDEPFHLIAVGSSAQEKVKPVTRPNVYYAGWVSSEKVSAYYDSADILVVPSRWEGFAMAPIEAMSRGRPVLASEASSLPEVVVPGKTGKLFPCEDVDSLVSILRGTKLEEWRDMGREARSFCRDHFNAEKMCALTRQVYETVSANKKSVVE